MAETEIEALKYLYDAWPAGVVKDDNLIQFNLDVPLVEQESVGRLLRTYFKTNTYTVNDTVNDTVNAYNVYNLEELTAKIGPQGRGDIFIGEPSTVTSRQRQVGIHPDDIKDISKALTSAFGPWPEAKILNYLGDDPNALAEEDRRIWADQPIKGKIQFDTYLPLDNHKVVLSDIVDYLNKALHLKLADNLGGVADKHFFPNPTYSESDMRSINFPAIPYHIIFMQKDAADIKAYVAKRLQELGVAPQGPVGGWAADLGQSAPKTGKGHAPDPDDKGKPPSRP